MTVQARHLSFNVHVMPSGAVYWVLVDRRGSRGGRVLSRGVLADPEEHQAPGDLEALLLASQACCDGVASL
jgi:hypothetical protein